MGWDSDMGAAVEPAAGAAGARTPGPVSDRVASDSDAATTEITKKMNFTLDFPNL